MWQITEDGPQGELISPLRAALLLREGGGFALEMGELERSIVVSPPREPAFEKVFGDAGPQSLTWYREGLSRAQAVARIETRTGRGIGTGFLIRAGDFFRSLDGGAADDFPEPPETFQK